MLKKLSPLLLCFLFNYSLFSQDYNISKDSIAKVISKSFILSSEGDHEEAIKLQNYALEWADRKNNDSIRGEAYHCMAVVYFLMEDYEKSKALYAKSLPALKKVNYKSYMIYHHNNLGELLNLEGDKKNAKIQLELARNMALEEKLTYNAFWPTHNLAMISYEQGDFEEAKTFFEYVIKTFQPNTEQQPTVRVNSHNYLAKIYYNKNNNKKALQHLRIADSLGRSTKDYPELIETEKLRYLISKNSILNSKANAALLRQIGYLKKNAELQKEQSKSNFKLQQKLLKNEKQLELTSKISQERKMALKTSRRYTYITLFFLLLTALISFLLFKSNKARLKLNQNLLIKNNELIVAKEKTEHASNLKTNFYSTISHELRTPLYAVNGITDILIEQKPRENQREYLNTLKSSGEYLLALINNVLQINKFDAKKIELNEIEFNLREMINNIKRALNYLKKENNNVILLDIDSSIPKILKGDSLKLSQIIINLLSNALKFTNNGNITLSVKKMESDVLDSINLKISIKDEGIGISKEMQDKIFDDFFQESMQLDRNYEGIGLGLAIVKRLLKAMDSEIKVTSIPGNGATFYFNVNLKVSEEKTIVKHDTPQADFSSFKDKSVLVVDDNSINQMITKRILLGKKINVTVVDNGFDAIEKAKHNDFDAILMDIHMPKMNGYEATKGIREFNTKVPILALTAIQINGNKDKILNSGMNGIIVKPFVLENFFNELKRFINSN